MAKYSSKPTVVNRSAAALAEKFADFSTLGEVINGLDEEQRAKIGDVKFDKDTISFVTPQVGTIVLRAVERTPKGIRLQAENSPVPINLLIDFNENGPDCTEVSGALDVDIPMMLRPLVGPALQKAADQFGTLFGHLA